MAKQPMLVGNCVLIVIDIQKSAFMDVKAGIPVMPGYADNMKRARRVVDAAHEAGTPVIFFQEIHRRNKIDYGRELDGTEDIHCLEGEPGTPVAAEEMNMLDTDYFIHKRRYSCFFGTELEILLKGLKAETLILIGGMTDVCVHYTFADAHQSDYYVRVVEDCVGGTSPDAHQASLNAMEYLQTGALRSAEEIIQGLQQLNPVAAA
jgi:nicotinamidase-related amidase